MNESLVYNQKAISSKGEHRPYIVRTCIGGQHGTGAILSGASNPSKEIFPHKVPLTDRSSNLKDNTLKNTAIYEFSPPITQRITFKPDLGHQNENSLQSLNFSALPTVQNEGRSAIRLSGLSPPQIQKRKSYMSSNTTRSLALSANDALSTTEKRASGRDSAVMTNREVESPNLPDQQQNTQADGMLYTHNESRLQIEDMCKQLSISGVSETDEFVNMIRAAQENETVYLPKRVVKVSNLVITKPIKIVGNPDSILEVSDSITIDLSEYPKLNKKVFFSECTIHFSYIKKNVTPNQSLTTRRSNYSEDHKSSDKKSYSENAYGMISQVGLDVNKSGNGSGHTILADERPRPLFIVKINSTLELRDSEVRSMNYIKDINYETHTHNDIAFFLKYPRGFDFKEDGQNLSLVLKNCIVNKFHTGVESLCLSSIYIEKSCFLECRSHAVNISNPYYFTIRDSTIEKSGKSSLNIRFSKEVSVSLRRKVIIENCDLLESIAYGVSIFGESMIHQAFKLSITNNRIVRSRKDGLGIKNLNFQEIQISGNTIADSQGNGVFLQNVIGSEHSSRIELKQNKVERSFLYGIAAIDVSIFSEQDEIVGNKKGGIIISGGDAISSVKEYEFYKSYLLRCIFNHCIISNNTDSGFIIVGCLKGPVILNSCKIYENLNGIYTRMKPIQAFKTSEEAGKAVLPGNQSTINSLGHVVLDRCTIFQNKDSGIYLKSLCEKLFLKETFIQENKSYAIQLAMVEDKHNLSINKAKIKQYVNGYVGGEWGLLYDEHEGACKANKCQIF